MLLKEAIRRSKVKPTKMAERKVKGMLFDKTIIVTEITFPSGIAVISRKDLKGYTRRATRKELNKHTDWKPIDKV